MRFSKSALKTLKYILVISENIATATKFLWFNKYVKYQKKPVFYEEFFEAGIYNFYQLTKPSDELFTDDEIAVVFVMMPNNRSFVKYIQLISALPLEWINNDDPANGLDKFIT